ncbi:MAG: DUF1844 domain-containing protein [Syntrophales bacterium]
MEEEKKSFVVKDRRVFSETGDVRAAEEPTAKTTAEAVTAQVDATAEPAEPEAAYMPEVNFANFIVSLSSTALFHFGEFQDPAQKVEKNLPAAKEIIDTLVMLKNKTLGNLEEKEKNILEGVLYELQMRYVKELR